MDYGQDSGNIIHGQSIVFLVAPPHLSPGFSPASVISVTTFFSSIHSMVTTCFLYHAFTFFKMLLSISIFKSCKKLRELPPDSYSITIPHICSDLLEFKYRDFLKAVFLLLVWCCVMYLICFFCNTA